ncbi:aldehyde ferredoxin oxidoreductase C-terminal domain-containing protein, partial [Chloroflexota bacterium]
RGILKERLGKDIRIAATGPAGDNMVPTAIVLADDDASGSSGFGAVMGSKKLKAIAVGGSKKVAVSNPEKLQELRKYALALRKDPPTIYSCSYRDPVVFRNPRLKKFACYGCINGCIRGVYEAETGERGKFMCWGVSFYTPYVQRYHRRWGDVPFLANRLCDQYGIDLGAIDVTMRWLEGCYNAGILTEEGTGIPISQLGSLEFMETLMKKMSYKEGFGEILSQGVLKASEIVGNGAKEHIPPIWFKNQIDQHYDPREYIITGLLYAMEPRQSMALLHEVSTLLLQWVDWCKNINNSFMSTEVFRAIAKRLFGSELAVDFSTYDGKALAVKKIQDRSYAKECLTLCDFTWPIKEVRHSEDHVGDPSLESKILSAVTGNEVDEEGLYRIGEKVFNLQRAVAVREGHKGREGDTLAEYNYTTPLAHGRLISGNPSYVLPGKDGEIIFRDGVVVDREKFEKMKDEYYQLREWDIPTGLQTKAKLAELGLQDVAQDLETRGLVV